MLYYTILYYTILYPVQVTVVYDTALLDAILAYRRALAADSRNRDALLRL